MKTACLFLVLCPIACLLGRPLPRTEGAIVGTASPLPGGERGPRPASSSAGAGRVRGLSGQPSQSIHRSSRSSTVRPRSIRTNAQNVHQPGEKRPAGAAKGAPRIVAPAITNVRHRSPNPAIVGGANGSKSNGTGSLSGTRMNGRR